MTEFYNLQITSKFSNIVNRYYLEAQIAEKEKEKEIIKITIIQAKFRMFRNYQRYKKQRKSAVIIQRYMRQFLGSKMCNILQNKRRDHLFRQYYAFQATTIQRYYKGYIKRKYHHDFFARKRFLKTLDQKNNQLKNDLERVTKNDLMEEEKRQQLCARIEFNKLAMNLHHLVSTKAQPGIFNGPLSKEHPKVFDIEVETHLRSIFIKQQPLKKLRQPSVNKVNQSTDNVGRSYRIRSSSFQNKTYIQS